jgi:hypothetical protein
MSLRHAAESALALFKRGQGRTFFSKRHTFMIAGKASFWMPHQFQASFGFSRQKSRSRVTDDRYDEKSQ